MKLRKLGSIGLAGLLSVSLLAFAGCGNTEQSSSAASGAETETKTETAAEAQTEAAAETEAGAAAEAETEAAAEAEAETAVAAAAVADGEIEEIEMYALSFFPPSGVEEIEAAINEISEPQIGVHVNYHALETGSFMQQIGLMLSGGERIDLLMNTAIPAVSFGTMLSQNQLMDISDYLEVYAPETMAFMDKYAGAMSVGDAVYGLPSYRSYNSSFYICMRRDILEALDLVGEAEKISSWSDYEAIMTKVQEAQDSLPEELRTTAMICNADGNGSVLNVQSSDFAAENFSDCVAIDTLADSNKIIYVDPATDKVGNYFATEDYKTAVKRVNDWYNKGLVYKDSAMNVDGADLECANGLTFSYVSPSEIGVEVARSHGTGYPMLCVKVCDIPVQTSNGNMWAWSVPVTTEAPEAAVAFMNLMYTNPEIENLLVYGIEGRDYEVNEDGEAVVNADAVYTSMDFYYGNQFNAYPAAGNGGDFRELALESLNNAEMSKYYGCVIDTNSIANEITAVSAVIKKYAPGLESGALDPAQIDTMLAEMEDAGVQKILDTYQEQLDAWLAQQ